MITLDKQKTKYNKYKPTGIDWIGDIPVDWEKKPFNFFLKCYMGAPFDSKNFSNENGTPLIRIRDLLGGQTETFYQGEYDEKYMVHNGDHLIGMDGDFHSVLWGGADGLLNQRNMKIVSDKEHISQKYLYYLMNIPLKKINDLTYATTVKHLADKDVRNILAYFPTLSKQEAIADYLDDKTSLIDNIVSLKYKQIDLLKERRTALINQAVTKGLDKNVEMIDSGVEWIGKIPKGWEVRKLKYIANISNGQDQKSVWTDNGEYPIFGSGGEFGRANAYLYDKPSVLLGRKGTIDRPLFVDEPFWTVDTMFYTKIFNNTNPKYLFYHCLFIEFNKYQMGTALPSMTQSNLSEIFFACPPLKEQETIVNYIETQTSQIDKTITVVEKSIGLLSEYKQSLISNVVTGKVKVF